MRLLYLDWPHLPLRLALGRDPDADEAVVLGGRPWDPGPVLDRSPAAGASGVRRGQPLGTAHSLVPEERFLPLDPAGLADPFEAALDALNALAPAVEGEVDPADPRFGRVLIGIAAVLLIASLGWIFDVFEGQIFVASMRDAMPDLLSSEPNDPAVGAWNNIAFGFFLLGGAVGQVVLDDPVADDGVVTDDFGRVPGIKHSPAVHVVGSGIGPGLVGAARIVPATSALRSSRCRKAR